jgi:hypothetical protein
MAVSSICEGITNGDDHEMRDDRFNTIPEKLGEAYEQIWTKIMLPPYEMANRLAFELLLRKKMPVREFVLTTRSESQKLFLPSDPNCMLLNLCRQAETSFKTCFSGLLNATSGITLSAEDRGWAWGRDADLAKVPFWGQRVLSEEADQLAHYQKRLRVCFMHRTAHDFVTSRLTRTFWSASELEALHLRMVRAKLQIWAFRPDY